MGKDIDRGGESLTTKPGTKRFRERSARLRQGKENHLRHRASLEWRLDQDRVCMKGGDAADVVPIAALLAVLQQSRTFSALHEDVSKQGLSVVYDSQSATAQYYSGEGRRIITLNPLRTRGDLLNALSREVRRAWQKDHGALVNPLHFDPDEAVLVNRAQQADVYMMSIKVGWPVKAKRGIT